MPSHASNWGRWRGAAIGLWIGALLLVACGQDTFLSSSASATPNAAARRPVGGAKDSPASPVAAAAQPEGSLPSDASAAGAPGVVVVLNEKDQSLSLIDAETMQVTKTSSLGFPPSGITVDPHGSTAWVFSSRPNESDVYFVDLKKGDRQGAKRLSGAPSAVAFSSDGLRSFLALREDNSVAILSSKRDELGRLLLGRQTLGVQIRRQPSAVATMPASTAGSAEVFYVAGEGSGMVWALDAGSGQMLAEIEVGGGPIQLLPAPTERVLYVVANTINQIVAIDSSTQQIVSRIGLPGRPSDAALGPNGLIYVSSDEADEVWAIDPSTGVVASRVGVGADPSGIALSPDGSRVYVANRGDDTLAVIDVPAGQVVATVKVGKEPSGVAFAVLPDETPTPTTTARPSPTPTLVPSPTALPPQAMPEPHPAPNTVTEVFVPGAEFPVALAFAPDNRLFYAEYRTGKIRIVENGALLPEPFYDFTVAGQPETGLIGLTLDPNFEQNHYVYVFYTAPAGADTHDGGSNGKNHVVRLTDVGGKGTDLTPILSDLPSGQVHNGGSLRFGPDGKLYITMGETGDMGQAKDLRSPAGKILRVNPDGSIPDDNPFAGQTEKYAAIWAYGFRNPFDLDFHPTTGVLISGESGPGDNDELNLVVKEGNYGWPPSGFQGKPDLVDPLLTLNPVVSPVGIAFYRGDQIPEWQNDLFYCTFHQGQLRRVRLAPESYDRVVFDEVVAYGCTLDVASGPDGALYYTDTDAIYRIRRADAPALPAVAAPGTPVPATTPALPPGTQPQDRDVNVNLTEWKIEPSRTVVPAGTIRFLVENLGVTVHSLRITGQGVDERTEDFGPGESRLLEVELAPGTYILTCPVGGHTEQGMATTLTVK